jgi:hypothetical protein
MLTGATSHDNHNGILFGGYGYNGTVGKLGKAVLLMLERKLRFGNPRFLEKEMFNVLLGKPITSYG